jgi:hypothetical protein
MTGYTDENEELVQLSLFVIVIILTTTTTNVLVIIVIMGIITAECQEGCE